MAQVTHVIGDCPRCGSPGSFGNIHLPDGQFLLRGCSVCEYNARIHLPPLRKKILYLDQLVFSTAFRKGDSRLIDLVRRVTYLQGLQMLVAPYSAVHEDETYQWSGHAEMTSTQLMTFIKETSRGIQLKPTWDVKSNQLVNGLRAFLADTPPNQVLDPVDAIKGQLHAYEDCYRIQINRPYFDDIEQIRAAKRKALLLLLNTFDEWRSSTTNFDEDVRLETASSGKAYLNTYLLAIVKGSLGDLDALVDGPHAVALVRQMLRYVSGNLSPDDKLEAIRAFFESQHFALVPCEWLSARMFATLKGLVRDGSFTNKKKAESKFSGFFYDVQHISTYAPYCDAVFLDDPMRDLLSRPTVGLTRQFGTRVFSLSNLDDFMDWLDSVENSMTDEHRLGLALAYPHWFN